jgi:hypothetical protein
MVAGTGDIGSPMCCPVQWEGDLGTGKGWAGLHTKIPEENLLRQAICNTSSLSHSKRATLPDLHGLRDPGVGPGFSVTSPIPGQR